MACDPYIRDPFQFPARARNRAGLARIAYRIGEYGDFVEVMTRAIDAAPELSAWTHRQADDPGIALLEGAAVLGDILSFYQEHYANEAYLRTATWRESVAELARLTGYRLAPGIGGRATLAFEARGEQAVLMRAGFPVKIELANQSLPADFETTAELAAWPHLGRFHLYRARHYGVVIGAGQKQFELAAADEARDSAALEAVELKTGDRLLLMPEENLLALLLQVLLGWKFAEQPAEEIVVVEAVTRARGRVVVTLAGNLTHGWLNQCRAYKLGRSFRHFGAAAPVQFVQTDFASPPVTSASNTLFVRDLRQATALGAGYSPIEPSVFPLDQEVTDLSAGSAVIITGTVTDQVGYALPFALARVINAVRATTPRWANLSLPASYLRLDQVLAPSWTAGFLAYADLRDLRLHETKGPALKLRPLSTPSAAAFSSGVQALRFYGTASQAQALASRRLHLAHADGRTQELLCTNTASEFAVPTSDVPKMWPLSFDRAPDVFTRADFDEEAPTVTVFGNLVDATQGKRERDAVLGNGDHRLAFQTFALPKAPLTYLLEPAATPPHTPELEVWVSDRLWTRVDSFYGRGPKEEIYVVREDAQGLSFVQFGDGDTGARLPSGIGNVKAVYRVGVGAFGAAKPGSVPTASERPRGFDKVALAGIVTGSAAPEDLDKARAAAPGKVQSLGRLVTLADYETETLAIPGVVSATASWDLYGAVPAVVLRVLLEAGREAEFLAVQAALQHAQRCSGPDRFALVVEQARPRYCFVDLTYARDPAFRQADVEAGLIATLGLAGDTATQRSGIFGLHARRLGAVEYASRIEGRLQHTAGVLWCKVTALGLLDAGITQPAAVPLPPTPRPLSATLACAVTELLQLSAAHLTLIAVDEPAAGECT